MVAFTAAFARAAGPQRHENFPQRQSGGEATAFERAMVFAGSLAPRAGKSGGERAALQTLREAGGRFAVAPASGAVASAPLFGRGKVFSGLQAGRPPTVAVCVFQLREQFSCGLAAIRI